MQSFQARFMNHFQWIKDTLDLTNRGLHIPSSENDRPIIDLDLPSYTIRRIDDTTRYSTIEIDFDQPIPDLVSDRGSSLILARRTQINKIKNFVHDFTYEIVTSETDCPLKKFFPVMNDGCDNQTPDLIFSTQDCYFVVEFATHQGDDLGSMNEVFQRKSMTYNDALQTRSQVVENPIIFLIIVVSRTNIVHNLRGLNIDLQIELILRYRLGLSLFDQLVRLEILPSNRDEEQTRDEKTTIQCFKSMFHQFRHTLNEPTGTEINLGKVWSKEFYHEILRSKGANVSKDDNTSWEEFIKSELSSIVNSSVKDDCQTLMTTDTEGTRIVSKKQKQLLDIYHQKKNDFVKRSQDVSKRSDNKSVVNMPLIIPSLRQDKEDMYRAPSFTIMDPEDPFYLFSKAFDKMRENAKGFSFEPEFTPKELHEGNEMLWNVDSERPSSTRSIYHRIELEIPREIEASLAAIGVSQNKKNFQLPYVKQYREFRKNSFPITQDTSDISDFLNTQTGLEISQPKAGSITSDNDFKKLIDKAWRIHNLGDDIIKHKAWSFVNEYMRTGLRLYTKFLSDLGCEITISLKQHCKPRNFILKKLRNWNCYVLIKPTNSESHIFFKLLYEKENDCIIINSNEGNVFKRHYENDRFLTTDFISLTKSKLTNWVSAEARFIGLTTFFMDFYGVEPYSLEFFENPDMHKVVWYDIKLSLLIHLSDKEEVETECTKTRYISMESFVCEPRWPNPSKMIEKFNMRPRSRLTIFIQQRQLALMEKIHKGFCSFRIRKPKMEEDDIKDENNIFKSTDDRRKFWNNILHPYQLTQLKDPGKLISLFYMGYLTNKNRKSEANTDGKLLEKIIEMELKFVNELEGFENFNDKINTVGTEYRDEWIGSNKMYQMYDPRFLSHIINNVVSQNTRKFGKNFLNLLESKIIKDLSLLTFENSMTTLKATSLFSDSNEKYKKKDRFFRSKVIQQTINFNPEEVLIMQSLERALRKLQSNASLHIDIFKKNQFGGLREIYVQAYEERIVQLVIETISRSICSFFSSETMTNPKSKNVIPSDHNRSISDNFKKRTTITVGFSDDAEKWSQGHYVSKFYHMLVMLTPTYMHPFLYQSLVLWMNKKIRIPQSLLDLLDSKENMQFYSESITEIYNAHKLGKQTTIMKHGENFVRIRTGMMQGILHATSSLYHTIYLEFLKEQLAKFFKQYIPDENMSMFSLQSSDDSSLVLTASYSSSLNYRKVMHYLNAAGLLKTSLGVRLGIYCSIKSTQLTPEVMEFNSIFHFDNSKFSPSIKACLASTLISEQESLTARQEEMSSLLSNVICEGGSFFVANGCQVGQALLHYRILGMSVNRFFSAFSSRIIEVPDPSCGFFLMDNIMCPGLLGMRYNYYLACINTPVGKLYDYLLNEEYNKTTDKLYNKDAEIDMILAGSMARKVNVTFGNRVKWTRLVQNLNYPDWERDINDAPDLLYRKARTKEELRLKCAIKLHNPMVSKSFDNRDHLPRIIASSVYMLTHKVLSPVSAWYLLDEEDKSEKIDDIGSKPVHMITYKSRTYYPIEISENKFVCSNLLITPSDIFNETCIAHCISADNMMSRGFAKDLCSKYPWNRQLSEEGFNPSVRKKEHDGITIYNLVTKPIYYNKPTQRDFRIAIEKLEEICIKDKIKTIHMPFIGSGRDKLPKNFVLDTLLQVFHSSPIKIVVHILRRDDLQGAMQGIKTNVDRFKRTSKFSLLSLIMKDRKRIKIDSKDEGNLVELSQGLTIEKLKFLFPFKAQYDDIKINLNSLRDVSPIKKTTILRSISTEIYVHEITDKLIIQPERVIGDIWFGTNKAKLSTTIRNKFFNSFKQIMPWLTHDSKESLQASPFSNHVQLQNWLARSDMRSRVLRINGAPIRSRSGISGIMTLIKNFYSSEYKLSINIADIDSDLTATPSDLKHCIYSVMLTPFSNYEKTQAIHSLLYNADRLEFNQLVPRSRTNTLSIMQTILHPGGIEEEKIIDRIIINKLGIIGHFVIAQKRDNSNPMKISWYGNGCWQGVMNGMTVKIYIYSDPGETCRPIAVFVNKKVNVIDFLKTFEDWISSMEDYSTFDVNTGRKQSDQLHERLLDLENDKQHILSFKGRSLCGTHSGVRLYLDPDLSAFEFDIRLEDISYEVSQNKFHITSKLKIDKKIKIKIRILHFKTSSFDYMPQFNLTNLTIDFKKTMQGFINQEPLEKEGVSGLIHSFMSDMFPPSFIDCNQPYLRTWLRELSLGSLERKGIVIGNLPQDIFKQSPAVSTNNVTDTEVLPDFSDSEMYSNLMIETLKANIVNTFSLNADDVTDWNELIEMEEDPRSQEARVSRETRMLLDIRDESTTRFINDTLALFYNPYIDSDETGMAQPDKMISDMSVLRCVPLLDNYFDHVVTNIGRSALLNLIKSQIYEDKFKEADILEELIYVFGIDKKKLIRRKLEPIEKEKDLDEY